MSKLSQAHPQIFEIDTIIEEVEITADHRSLIRLRDDLFRYACGGQPADHGWLTFRNHRCRIDDVIRRDGQRWLSSNEILQGAVGTSLVATVDAARRLALSRAHSLTHVLMGCLRRHIPAFECRGADIHGEGQAATIFFSAASVVADKFDQGIIAARTAVQRGADVEIFKIKSIEAATRRFPSLRIDPDLRLNGRVRVVNIEGIDTNPCSGSHVSDIAQIGVFDVARLSEANGVLQLTVTLPVGPTH
jgi:misacylated tRNA(Ala) deacylase